MVIDEKNNNGDLVLTPHGRLDSTTSEQLEKKLNECFETIGDDVKSLTIDLADVDFISSKGVRVLVSAYKKLEGKSFTLMNANNSIREVIKLSGLEKAFKIV